MGLEVFDDLVIFEMANNHQGSLQHGLTIVEEMAKIKRRHGIRAAVKLQYRDLDTFIHPAYRERRDLKHIPRFLDTRLAWEELHTLCLATREAGMTSVITAFDEPSVDMALNHGVDILKVASCSATDWPLLERVSKAGKPVICSTGGCSLVDIDRIVSFFEHRDVQELALLHCVGIYPTPDEEQQLAFMLRMMRRYPEFAIGYSGHEAPGNLRVVIAAVAMGARLLERHVGVPTDTIALNAYSMDPEQTDRWVGELVATRTLCGTRGADKRVGEAETASLQSLQRGVYARNAITKGDLLRSNAIMLAMPCGEGQTAAKEYLPTMTADEDYEPLAPVTQRRPHDPIQLMRGIVHEAKGLLREAGIAIGSEYQIELSHHFGMESFRRFGCVMLDFFNREYCKKLIVMLPVQAHPPHAHHKKEETFQILYGDLNLEIEGQTRHMRPGDVQLVRRGDTHSFSTREGVIFEEVSTTHIRGDSYYPDERIRDLDPVRRKTVIERW